ncbi:MAG: response regulator [bacterium]|nr:response regulator [bacterium]
MKKILIIDDDTTFQKTMSDSLASLHYTVASALDGEEGLAKALAEKPDLILLDIKMPKMDGITFLKKLQSGGEDSTKIPVLVTSNISTMDNISEGIALGIKGYIVKSDESLDTIVQHVEELLNPKKGVSGLPSRLIS